MRARVWAALCVGVLAALVLPVSADAGQSASCADVTFPADQQMVLSGTSGGQWVYVSVNGLAYGLAVNDGAWVIDFIATPGPGIYPVTLSGSKTFSKTLGACTLTVVP